MKEDFMWALSGTSNIYKHINRYALVYSVFLHVILISALLVYYTFNPSTKINSTGISTTALSVVVVHSNPNVSQFAPKSMPQKQTTKSKPDTTPPVKTVSKTTSPTKPQNKTSQTAKATNSQQAKPTNNKANQNNSPQTYSALLSTGALQYINNSSPSYPYVARQNGWQGTVVLKATITSTGNVTNIMVYNSSGHTVLDNAALVAVGNWKFKNLQNQNIDVTIPIEFIID